MMSDDMMMKDDTMMEKEDTMMKDDGMMKKEGVYTTYDSKLLGMYSDTVLFFHAAWCPSCKTTDTNLKADDVAGNNIAILKVDYDSSTELKKKYGVTMQHTFVQVDSKGEMIQKWSGSSDLDDILGKLK
jgi:thiol-disulfide isomerase/thioredoxin